MIRRLVVLSLGAVIALALMAVPAGAAAPELRGVVSGSPYGASGGYIAVPVLYSKMTARRVGLKSPVGLMVVKRTARIKVTGAPSSLPINLRVGDRFKGNAAVSDLNKRIFYPRITFDQAPSVYFRSKELSLAELTRLLQQVQANLGALSKFTLDTFGQVATQLQGLQKQINDLKALIDGLGTVDLSGLQGQIDGILAQLAALPDFSTFARLADLPDLSDFLTAADLPDLSGFLTEAEVQALIDAALANLDLLTEADVNALIAAALGNLDLLTEADVNALIAAALGNLDLLTEADVQALIDTALAGLDIPTTDEIQDLIDTTVAGLDIPTQAEIETIVNDAITAADIPGLVDTAVGNLTAADLPAELLTVSELSGALPTSIVHSSELSSELDALLPGTGLDALATDGDVSDVAADLDTVCDAVRDASVDIDPNDLGIPGVPALPPVTVPVDLGTNVNTVCAP